MRRLFPALLLMALALPLEAAQTPPPADCEVRTWRDAFTRDTYTSLTLMLRGPKGPIPINMVLTVVHPARLRAGSGPAVRLEFLTSTFAGQFDFKAPQLVMVLDRDLPGESIEAYAVESTAAMFALASVTVPCDPTALRKLAAATTIDGRLMGVHFVLTARQLRAIQDLARRELR